jgi:hypothetical protein
VQDFLRPSESVRDIENQDGAVLLDIRQGLCLSLTPCGAIIWNLLKVGRAEDEIARSLSSTFPDVALDEIYADMVNFTTALADKGLLVSKDRPLEQFHIVHSQLLINLVRHLAMTGTRFLFWRALGGLLAFDLFRLGDNFHKLYGFMSRWKVTEAVPPTDIVAHICKAVNYAAAVYPKRIRCLQRSAVTTCLLRSCGVPAEMVIGAQRSPFKAHAWTEVDGCPVNERRDVRSVYLIWERC